MLNIPRIMKPMEQLLQSAFEQAKILVVGDVMLDRYWYGAASRISPEAPVPVVNVSANETRPGGAANVALNVRSLGSQVVLLGVVGKDSEGQELKKLLHERHVECDFLEISDYSTTTKLRVVSQNQQLLRIDFETTDLNFDRDKLLKHFEKQLKSCDLVVVSDYAKGSLVDVATMIELSRAANIPVLIDPKSKDFTVYHGATLITPNLKEFEAVVGHCKDTEDLIHKAQGLIQAHHLMGFLITRGAQGMILVENNGHVVNLPAHAREVYDVSGAGDTVIAVLAASLASELSLAQSVRLANLAAGLVVRKMGTASVTLAEIRQALHEEVPHTERILTREQLMTAVSAAREQGETLVMTNGCFDILHAGHVEYLQAAKERGDRLIIAVNDDDSVRRLKGNDRPINTVRARMEVLAGLSCVDWVVSFGEDTPEQLITDVLPDVLVKGADYQGKPIAGSEAVLKNGGKIELIPLKEGFSTTKIIEKIR